MYMYIHKLSDQYLHIAYHMQQNIQGENFHRFMIFANDEYSTTEKFVLKQVDSSLSKNQALIKTTVITIIIKHTMMSKKSR